MLVEYMSRNKRFFSWFEYHKFYVLYQFVTYLLTPRTQCVGQQYADFKTVRSDRCAL
jgi:hypothetical protein